MSLRRYRQDDERLASWRHPDSIALVAVVMMFGCGQSGECRRRGSGSVAPEPAVRAGTVARDWAMVARQRMVDEQIEARGIRDPLVLAAMRKVARHEFIPLDGRDDAYQDHPVPIGYEQTISQPYMVAKLVELAGARAGSKVLEVGTGSGYTSAVLAEIAGRVYSIEIVAPLATRAEQTLARLGYDNLRLRVGDGYAGWASAAPFDAIVVSAAPPEIPQPLKAQLAIGGNLVIPVGDERQELRVLTRTSTGFNERVEFPVLFVPMEGKAQGE